ncbi:hypothetical protein [Paraburkholderia sp. EG304]|uniref:hypothetical protein n=1 Tax=Paraburkholderia sp. EG304 TaxID=3237015 RepID=UPI00397BDFB9
MHDGALLLGTLMRDGQRCVLPPIDKIRAYASQELASLPAHLRMLNQAELFHAYLSEQLKALVTQMDRA